jgi:hypothetical protein
MRFAADGSGCRLHGIRDFAGCVIQVRHLELLGSLLLK